MFRMQHSLEVYVYIFITYRFCHLNKMQKKLIRELSRCSFVYNILVKIEFSRCIKENIKRLFSFHKSLCGSQAIMRFRRNNSTFSPNGNSD